MESGAELPVDILLNEYAVQGVYGEKGQIKNNDDDVVIKRIKFGKQHIEAAKVICKFKRYNGYFAIRRFD